MQIPEQDLHHFDSPLIKDEDEDYCFKTDDDELQDESSRKDSSANEEINGQAEDSDNDSLSNTAPSDLNTINEGDDNDSRYDSCENDDTIMSNDGLDSSFKSPGTPASFVSNSQSSINQAFSLNGSKHNYKVFRKRKGARCLSLDGYLYRRTSQQTNGVSYWRCEGRGVSDTTFVCPGAAKVSVEGAASATTPHNHDPYNEEEINTILSKICQERATRNYELIQKKRERQNGRRSMLLSLDGYLYTKSGSRTDGSSYWRCEENRLDGQSCQGSAKIEANGGANLITPHTHSADYGKIEARKMEASQVADDEDGTHDYEVFKRGSTSGHGKKGTLLALAGYLYVKGGKGGDGSSYWRCEDHKYLDQTLNTCQGSAKLKPNGLAYVVSEHDHAPDYSKSEQRKADASQEETDQDMDLQDGDIMMIPTRRGGQLLCFQGYMYVKAGEAGGKIYWKCRDKSSGVRCPGSAKQKIGKKPVASCQHNHPPDEMKIKTKAEEFLQIQDSWTSDFEYILKRKSATGKRGQVLHMDGFIYVRNSAAPDGTTYWRCEHHNCFDPKNNTCLGAAKVNAPGSALLMQPHDHDADAARVEQLRSEQDSSSEDVGSTDYEIVMRANSENVSQMKKYLLLLNGYVLEKVSGKRESFWRCELHKFNSPTYTCTGSAKIKSNGLVYLMSEHDHMPDFATDGKLKAECVSVKSEDGGRDSQDSILKSSLMSLPDTRQNRQGFNMWPSPSFASPSGTIDVKPIFKDLVEQKALSSSNEKLGNSSSSFELVPSKRGNSLLKLDGYTYCRAAHSTNVVYWQCVFKNRPLQCKGSAKQRHGEIPIALNSHNHPASDFASSNGENERNECGNEHVKSESTSKVWNPFDEFDASPSFAPLQSSLAASRLFS